MALKLPNNPGICDAMAQIYGALAPSEFGCVPVSGREVKIKETLHSIMEFAEIVNFNFHCSGSKSAVQVPEQLPGPVEESQKQEFV